MIQNGKPVTREMNGSLDTALMSREKQEVQDAVAEWIRLYLLPTKNTPLDTRTSYELKHIFEKDTGIHLTNNQFKDAMLQCGYYPVDPEELNWRYCLSKKSPAFKQELFGKRTLSVPKETLFQIWATR